MSVGCHDRPWSGGAALSGTGIGAVAGGACPCVGGVDGWDAADGGAGGAIAGPDTLGVAGCDDLCPGLFCWPIFARRSLSGLSLAAVAGLAFPSARSLSS